MHALPVQQSLPGADRGKPEGLSWGQNRHTNGSLIARCACATSWLGWPNFERVAFINREGTSSRIWYYCSTPGERSNGTLIVS